MSNMNNHVHTVEIPSSDVTGAGRNAVGGTSGDDMFQMFFSIWNRYVRPYLWLYPIAVVLFMVGGYVYLQTAVPLFRSTCRLHISSNQMQIMNVKGIEDPGYLNASGAFINTQILLLQSREIAEAAREKMKTLGNADACSTPEVEIVRGTTLVDISVSSPAPKDAAAMANALADAYMEKMSLRKITLSTTGSDLLRDQLALVQKKYDAAVLELLEFKKKHGIFDFQVSYKNLVDQLNELNKLSFDTQTSMDEITLTLQGIKENRSNAVIMLPYLLNNEGTENLSSLQSMLLSHEMGLPQLMSQYNEGHQVVKLHHKVGEMIRAAQENEIEISLKGLDLKRARLQKRVDSYQKQLAETSRKLSELDKLGGEYKLLENTCSALDDTIKMLVNRINEIQISEASNKLDNYSIFVVNRAEPALSAYFPVPREVFAKMFVLGLVISGGIAFLLASLNNKVTEMGMMNMLLGTKLPIFGMIPNFSEDEHVLLKSRGNDDIDETFRDIRTSLNLSMITRNSRVLGITSSLPGEGKTFTACNLARSFARDNKKILLVDLDMRKPRMHKILEEFLKAEKVKRGISNILVGDCSLDEAVVRIPDLNLDVIFAGPIPPNPAELLSSGCLEAFLKEAKEKYDLIVLDTPPIILVADTLIIAGYQVPLLLVSRLYRLPKAAVQHLRNKLSQLNIGLTGLIGNNVDVPKSAYKSFSSYEYYNYSGESAKNYRYGYRMHDKSGGK